MTLIEDLSVLPVATAEPAAAVSAPVPSGRIRAERSLAAKFAAGASRGCQRCLEAATSRPLLSSVVTVSSWPFLSPEAHWAELGLSATVVSAALAGGRRQSLLSLAGIVRHRFRLFMVRRKFSRVIGTNAAISKALTAHDLIGNPTKSPGKEVPKLRRWGRFFRGRYVPLKPRWTPSGMVVTMDGRNIGAIAAAFEAEASIIAGSFGAFAAEVHKHHIFQELTVMSLTFEDPFAKTIPFKSLPAPSSPEMVVVGIDRDHEPVEQSLWLPHLAVGEMGSGKSSWAHVMIAGVVELNLPLRLWVFDPKGGVEFYDYERAAYRYVKSPYLWVDMLRELIETMQDKLDRIRGVRREVDTSDPAFGIDLVVIDEILSISNFVDDKDSRNQVKVTLDGQTRRLKPSDAFNHLLSQQRAAGMCTVALSQMGGKDNIKNRDLFPEKTIFHVASDEVVTMLGFSAKNHRAHEIPPGREFSGVGYCKTARGVVNFRAGFLTGPERSVVADRVLEWTNFFRLSEGTDIQRVEYEISRQRLVKQRAEAELERLVAQHEAASSGN